MTERSARPDAHLNIAQDRPNHDLGSYRSWNFDVGRTGPFDMIWIHEVGSQPATEQLLPFMEPSIVIRRTSLENGNYDNVELLVSAAMPDSGCHTAAPNDQLIALRLRPELSGPQLGLWARDHQDHNPQIAGASLRNAATNALRSADTMPASDVAAELVKTVVQVADTRCDDWLTDAVHLVRHSEGRISCGNLAEQMDVSARHLHRSFKSQFGYSPKEFARRTRFTAAMIEADAHATPKWADIALAFGYSDQSHLNRDCRHFLLTGPAQAHRSRRAMSDSSKIES